MSISLHSLLATALLLAGSPASVQAAPDYPTRPVRLIVNFPAGGTGDLIARTIQRRVEQHLGQPLIVENRAGAGGVLGTDSVAKAAPDGYVIGMGGTGSMAINVALNEKMPYDPLGDLVPITLLADIPFVLAAARSVPVNSVDDVIALAKAKPDALSIGHGGNATAMQLTAQLFNQMAGLNVALVPYKGSAPLAADVLGGHVSLAVMDLSSISLIKAGQIKALAVSSRQRVAVLPTVPTIAEAGLPGFESGAWLGIVAPAGTPSNIITKRNEAIVSALKDPAIIERIRAVGVEPAPTGPTEFGDFIRHEITKWTKVAIAAGARGN
jgi:tripartite-type tricarboxylate transporter receptor subunit TctC